MSSNSKEIEKGNLVVTRREGESVRIGDDIEVTVIQSSASKVQLKIRAPKTIAIVRDDAQNRE